jgi:hypothetical protein
VPTDALASILARAVAARCGAACDCDDCAAKHKPAGAQRLAREPQHVWERTLQRSMKPCPKRLAGDPGPGWVPYVGDTLIFHCGYRTMLEDRQPTPDDPIQECVYDDNGRLVDKDHAYADCRGTPDQYYAKNDKIRHALLDSGGIWHAGGPAFRESMWHAFLQIGGFEQAFWGAMTGVR